MGRARIGSGRSISSGSSFQKTPSGVQSQKLGYRLGQWVPVLPHPSFAINDDRFVDRDAEPDQGEIQISSTPTGDFHIEGKVTMRMGLDGFEPVFWAPGVTHTWIGKNKVGDHIFDSSADWPLDFRVDKVKGYRYLRGQGTLTLPDGKVVRLP